MNSIVEKFEPKRGSNQGFVYIIKEDFSGSYKIGRTSKVDQRMNVFGVQLPFKFNLFHLIACKDQYKVEKYFHDFFKEKRNNGEWFSLNEEELAWIKEERYMLDDKINTYIFPFSNKSEVQMVNGHVKLKINTPYQIKSNKDTLFQFFFSIEKSEMKFRICDDKLIDNVLGLNLLEDVLMYHNNFLDEIVIISEAYFENGSYIFKNKELVRKISEYIKNESETFYFSDSDFWECMCIEKQEKEKENSSFEKIKNDMERIEKYIQAKNECKLQVIRRGIFNKEKDFGLKGKGKSSIEIYNALKEMRLEESKVDEMFCEYEQMDFKQMVDKIIKDFQHLDLKVLKGISRKSLDDIFKVFEELKEQNPYIEELYKKIDEWDVQKLIRKSIDKVGEVPFGIIYHFKFKTLSKATFKQYLDLLYYLKDDSIEVRKLLERFEKMEPHNKIKWLIAETGDCPRRDEIRPFIGIDNNRVSAIFQELAKEKWIELIPSKGYTVIVSDEKRKMYLENN